MPAPEGQMFSREAIYEMLLESKRIEDKARELGWEVAEIIAQSTQEMGEFSEASMIKNGTIRHKELEHDNHPFEEAADTMICIMDALSRLYPHMPASQVYCTFLYWMTRKTDKWVNKVEKEYDEVIGNGS